MAEVGYRTKFFLACFFLLLPPAMWAAIIGYLLGIKIVLILLLIIPAILFSAFCKLVGKIILTS